MANVRKLTINPLLTDTEFAGFCGANHGLNIDRDSSGVIIVMRKREGRDDYGGRSMRDQQTKKEIKGVCFLFSETGTEGGWWAVQEDGFASDDGDWKYEGVRYLEEGDDFTVYADDGSVLFHGIIHQDSRTGAIPRQAIRDGKLVSDPTWKQQVVAGFWVHWIQKGIDPIVWDEWFTGYNRCLVIREEMKRGTAKVRRRR